MGIEKYQDMIEMERPASSKHPRMSLYDRAAQFSPFAALTGHEEAIAETGRLTEQRIVLTEQKKEELDQALGYLTEQIQKRPEATVTYFKEDEKKEGGSYLTITERLVGVNSQRRSLLFETGLEISLDDICEITARNCVAE